MTQTQRNQLAQTYLEDAQARGVDQQGMIRELLTFLLAPRQQQINQLVALAQRRRAALADVQANFDAQKAAEEAAINSRGDALDALVDAIPGIDG